MPFVRPAPPFVDVLELHSFRPAVTVRRSAAAVLVVAGVAKGALMTVSNDISATMTTLKSLDAADAWKNAFADSEACKSLSKS